MFQTTARGTGTQHRHRFVAWPLLCRSLFCVLLLQQVSSTIGYFASRVPHRTCQRTGAKPAATSAGNSVGHPGFLPVSYVLWVPSPKLRKVRVNRSVLLSHTRKRTGHHVYPPTSAYEGMGSNIPLKFPEASRLRLTPC
eukprot:4258753-Amphidinium_carterae.1